MPEDLFLGPGVRISTLILNKFTEVLGLDKNVNNTPTIALEGIPNNESKKPGKGYSGYTKGTILHTQGNVRVDSDSSATCCQDDKKATDTFPGLNKN